ncbi:MAG: hypothetical protein ABJA34_07570 [Pseudonocardiales bacterium]
MAALMHRQAAVPAVQRDELPPVHIIGENRPTLMRGVRANDVLEARGKIATSELEAKHALVTPGNDFFDDEMHAHVTCTQDRVGLKPDGIIGPLTWSYLDGLLETVQTQGGGL